MPDPVTPPPTAPPTGYTLWFRPNRRCAWEPLGAFATERAAFDAIAKAGKRRGDWQTLPADKQP